MTQERFKEGDDNHNLTDHQIGNKNKTHRSNSVIGIKTHSESRKRNRILTIFLHH